MTEVDPTEEAIPTAVELAIAVTDYDAVRVDKILAPLDRQQLYALTILMAAHIDLDRPLSADIPEAFTPHATVTRAVTLAAEMFCIDPDEVTSDSRSRPALDARAVAMAALRLCGMSSPQIGHAFHRDHSTVLYAATRVGENGRLHALAKRIAMQCGWTREDAA